MNINDIVVGMTPQEKALYFAHMEKRHAEEKEKLEAEKAHLRAYKQSLIDDILTYNHNYTREELIRMSIRTLERIAY